MLSRRGSYLGLVEQLNRDADRGRHLGRGSLARRRETVCVCVVLVWAAVGGGRKTRRLLGRSRVLAGDVGRGSWRAFAVETLKAG